jgi:hypothetical protein
LHAWHIFRLYFQVILESLVPAEQVQKPQRGCKHTARAGEANSTCMGGLNSWLFLISRSILIDLAGVTICPGSCPGHSKAILLYIKGKLHGIRRENTVLVASDRFWFRAAGHATKFMLYSQRGRHKQMASSGDCVVSCTSRALLLQRKRGKGARILAVAGSALRAVDPCLLRTTRCLPRSGTIKPLCDLCPVYEVCLNMQWPYNTLSRFQLRRSRHARLI